MASVFANVKEAPVDAIFGINQAYVADPSPLKVNLGVGAYRTEEGKPLVLPTVRKVEQQLLDAGLNKEYQPIEGVPSFTRSAPKLILGPDSEAIREERVFCVQALGGTGAIRLGLEFLKRFFPNQSPTVLIPDPTWANHKQIAEHAGLAWSSYRYYDPSTRGLDFAGLIEDLSNAPDRSIVLLHSVAHNPTGVDPTEEEWGRIVDVVQRKGHFAFADCAYQGFASGNLLADSFSARLLVQRGLEFFVAQSFSKNFGLYGERVGCLTMVLATKEAAEVAGTQMRVIVRGMYSNPPSTGARIVGEILSSPLLYSEWEADMQAMSSRMLSVRRQLYDLLLSNNTPGDWSHVIKQIGMFTYLGLSPEQVKVLTEKYHIYMTSTARISVAGLNSSNVAYLANAIHDVVTGAVPKL